MGMQADRYLIKGLDSEVRQAVKTIERSISKHLLYQTAEGQKPTGLQEKSCPDPLFLLF